MSVDYRSRVSHSFRLPLAVAETLDSLASDLDMSKTEVVSEAIERMRRQRVDELIAEGFAEMAGENQADARAAATAMDRVADTW